MKQKKTFVLNIIKKKEFIKWVICWVADDCFYYKINYYCLKERRLFEHNN